jgi:hypothetical protein
MPRYNLKDVLQSTALVAVGLSLIAAVFARKPPGATWPDLGAPPFFVGGAFIGGGILVHFKKTWLGFLLGALAAGVFWLFVGMSALSRM